MLEWVLGRRTAKKQKKSGQPKKPNYEDSKRIAASGSETDRAALAKIEDLEPEFLYLFATDKAASVRRAVAGNDGSPLQADLILARDIDPQVRADLAYKIGRLVPSLTADESDRLAEMAFQVLEILGRDQLPSIRAIVADEIKHLDNMPPKIIQQLARDAEAAVAGPILEYSPLLNDEQLMQIIASGLRGGALQALARRKNVSGQVSAAIVAQDEDPAIAELLNNQTAQISEKLMDEIAVRAERTPDLHVPLVDRGSLSAATIRRIAMFVSAALVERLIAANKLDERLSHEIRLAVRERIDSGEIPVPSEDADAPSEKKPEKKPEDSAARAEALHRKGALDEYAVLDAIDEADKAFLRRAFTLLSGLKDKQVGKMLDSGSAKGLCALTWKAGLGADIAVSLQRRIGRVPAKSMIHEADDGGYRMPASELAWYVDYFKS